VGSAFACGLIFALGLGLSGMTQPSKVLGFLDVVPGAQGGWDPSLAFVMVGAIGVHAIFVRLARRATAPLFAERFVWPADGPVDRRLIAGACIFGIGWGLAGYCPGPALVGVASASPGVLLFVAAMGVGTVAAGASSITGSNRRQARQSHQASP
jgi:hypothetical protein